MRTQTLLLLLLLWGIAGSAQTTCDPNRLDIPYNGVDEDCDGLDGLFMHLPPYIYVTEGQDFELYYRNAILSRHPQHYSFRVVTPLWGTAWKDRWSFYPTKYQVGEYPLTLYVQTPNGQVLDSARTVVRVTGATMPADTQQRHILLLGHSFFDQGYLPKLIRDQTRLPHNPPVKFHGKKVTWADDQARHEGHGGWTWHRFTMTSESPLYYNGRLDMRRYFKEVVGNGKVPDYVVIYLDINDFCGYSSLRGNTLQEIDDTIRVNWNRYARPLLDSIRAAAPLTKIALCYAPAPEASQPAFTQFYGNFVPAVADLWRWQKIINRLAFQYVRHYGGREAEGIYLIPTHLDLDDVLEYGFNDPIHPAPLTGDINGPSGYREIAKSIYAWLRYGYQLRTTPLRQRWFRDADGDGFGNAGLMRAEFSAPTGFVADSTDCDDANPLRSPKASEITGNKIDDDCDGVIDEDANAPSARCKPAFNLTLDFYGRGNINSNQVDAGSNDVEGGIIRAVAPTSFDCRHVGVQTVQLTVTDLSGNSATCETRITVLDTLPPTVKQLVTDIFFRFVESQSFGAIPITNLVSTDERCLQTWEMAIDQGFVPIKDLVILPCDLVKRPQPLLLRLRAVDGVGNPSPPVTIRVTLQGGCNGFYAPGFQPRAQAKDFWEGVKVYPNPARHWLTVQAEGAPVTQWALYDLTGRLLTQQDALSTSQVEISLSETRTGVYALKVWQADGTLTTKMISVL